MSRTLKLIVYAALIEMVLVALGVFAWRHGAFGWLPAPGPSSRPRLLVVFLPAWFVVGAVYAGRRLGSERPRISDTHRRYLEGSLQIVAAASVALQGLYAYVEVTGAAMDNVLMLRGGVAFTGLLLAIQGNSVAKLDPPTGEGAPAPQVWTRMALRFGWIMVAMGLVTVICAFALPTSQLLPVMITVGVVGLGIEIVYRRMTRPRRPA